MSIAQKESYALTPLEVALGRPLGIYPGTPELPDAVEGRSMKEALEAATLKGLSRSPCYVSFSGGRDSSGVLALATQLARREGLDLPIPLTLRFPSVQETEEAAWQENVVRLLELDEWDRIDVDDELDMLGPAATKAMTRHGLMWPFNAFFITLALERARGGSLITGVFGDEVLGQDPWLVRRRLVLLGKARLRSRDLLRAGLLVIPRPVRTLVDTWRGYPHEKLPEWLTPRARSETIRALASDRSQKPLNFKREVSWWWRRRYAQVGMHSLRLLGRDYDCDVVAPYLDPEFMSTFAVAGGWFGFTDRTQVMRILFQDLLPQQTVERTSKASFAGVFWNTYTTRFLSTWNGEGLDPSLVDVDFLIKKWKERPGDAADRDFRSALLLQSAWLAENGSPSDD